MLLNEFLELMSEIRHRSVITSPSVGSSCCWEARFDSFVSTCHDWPEYGSIVPALWGSQNKPRLKNENLKKGCEGHHGTQSLGRETSLLADSLFLSDCDNAVPMPPADLVTWLLISSNDLFKWSFKWSIYLFIYISIESLSSFQTSFFLKKSSILGTFVK